MLVDLHLVARDADSERVTSISSRIDIDTTDPCWRTTLTEEVMSRAQTGAAHLRSEMPVLEAAAARRDETEFIPLPAWIAASAASS